MLETRRRWQETFLQSLTSRKKWHTLGSQLEPGQLVLLKVTSAIPSQRTMGRIVAVHLGEDNIVNVKKVRITEGFFTRPISQISLHPNYNLSAGEV